MHKDSGRRHSTTGYQRNAHPQTEWGAMGGSIWWLSAIGLPHVGVQWEAVRPSNASAACGFVVQKKSGSASKARSAQCMH